MRDRLDTRGSLIKCAEVTPRLALAQAEEEAVKHMQKKERNRWHWHCCIHATGRVALAFARGKEAHLWCEFLLVHVERHRGHGDQAVGDNHGVEGDV